jgi:hypothetical protein
VPGAVVIAFVIIAPQNALRPKLRLKRSTFLACPHSTHNRRFSAFAHFAQRPPYARRMPWKPRVDVRLATQVRYVDVSCPNHQDD